MAKHRQMKLKNLESFLEGVEKFENPKNDLEQYMTEPYQAAAMLFAIQSQYQDIIGKSVVDLGCGTGMLSMGASIMGADYVLGIEKDEEAIEIFQRTREEAEYWNIDFMITDIVQLHPFLSQSRNLDDNELTNTHGLYKKFDTVIMNPPFGTKEESKGIDMVFLETAVAMATSAVYSFHKSSTRKYIVHKKAKELDVEAEVLESFKFDIPRTYKFHKKKSDSVKVDFIRFALQ